MRDKGVGMNSEPISHDEFHCEQCGKSFLDQPHATEDGYWLCHSCWKGLIVEDRAAELNSDNLDLLALRVVSICKRNGWSLHWTGRGAYLHLEASELIEAVRGKRGDITEEAADVLLVLLSILQPKKIPFEHVKTALLQKVIKLEQVSPSTGEVRPDIPPVLWINTGNEANCFNANRHKRHDDDARYLLSSQADAAYMDALRDAARREQNAAATMLSVYIESVREYCRSDEFRYGSETVKVRGLVKALESVSRRA